AALRENRARTHRPTAPRGSEAARPKTNLLKSSRIVGQAAIRCSLCPACAPRPALGAALLGTARQWRGIVAFTHLAPEGRMTRPRSVIESWRRHYNAIRPPASIGYKPPAPEVFVSGIVSPRDARHPRDQPPQYVAPALRSARWFGWLEPGMTVSLTVRCYAWIHQLLQPSRHWREAPQAGSHLSWHCRLPKERRPGRRGSGHYQSTRQNSNKEIFRQTSKFDYIV